MSTLVLENKQELPTGWELAKISDLVFDPKQEIVDGPFGSNLKATEYVEKGIPLIRLQNVDRNSFVDKNIKYITKEKAKRLKRHNFESNDIIITKLGIPLGEACIVPDYFPNGIIVADIIRIRLNHELISKKFLMHLINSDQVIQQFKKHTKGTTRPRVNLTQMRNFDVQIPPLNEQKRIVEKIEEAFSELDHTKTVLEKIILQLEQHKKSLLKSAFKGRLIKFEQIQVPLSEIFERKSGKFLPKNKMNKGTIPVFGGNGIMGYHDENYLESDILIIGRVGAHCGNVHQFSGKLWITDNTIGLLPKIKINSKFFLYQLRNMRLNEMSAGSGQPYISGQMLSELNLISTDIIIQNKIVFQIEQCLSLIENTNMITNLLLKQLDTLHSSILKKAFEGKLIPQDPNDEPAEILLQKIKQEKQQLKQKEKSKKRKKNAR